MNGGIALPRIRVRSRRRRPRTPWWRFCALWFALSLALLASDVITADPFHAVCSATYATYFWRQMQRPMADPEARLPSRRELQTDHALAAAGCALALTNLAVL